MSETTYDLGLLERSRSKWARSPGVRAFYGEVFTSMMGATVPGDTLELGSGIGGIKDFYPEVCTSDVEKTPYVDLALSCYAIEESGREWDNLIALDVLHHLTRPLAFLESAASVLRPSGRIVLVEPAATAMGLIFYRLFHHEPIAPGRLNPPFEFDADTDEGEFANMGMAVALFGIHRATTMGILGEAGIELRIVQFRDLVAYPLTGGFSRPQLLPTGLLRVLFKLEKMAPQFLLKRLGIRIMIVFGKKQKSYS